MGFLQNHFGLVVVAFEAANKFIESLPAAVGGGAVLAALVLAIIALLVAGGVSDRVEEWEALVDPVQPSGDLGHGPREARARTAPRTVLPMQLRVGDRFADETGEWEVGGRSRP